MIQPRPAPRLPAITNPSILLFEARYAADNGDVPTARERIRDYWDVRRHGIAEPRRGDSSARILSERVSSLQAKRAESPGQIHPHQQAIIASLAASGATRVITVDPS